ncbi:DUF3526 domain-containing protein [bacterium]|nr:MAG: DUF3526 domain-containing protein [bacterium]
MLSTLIQKEIRALLLSPKFSLTLVACSVLILLSIYTGINEYKASMRLYETASQIESTNFQEARNLMSAQAMVHRQPNPIQIFSTGIHFDVGRLANIARWYDPNFTRSIYSETPVFALFRMLDLSFIFQVILTLFAVLFTYDAISGEKESGTLKLTFTNSVSRAQYLIAKMIGSSIGLLAPLLIPILIGLIMIQLFGIHLTTEDWLSILLFLGSGFVLILVFMIIGLSISAWTSKSSTSFLVLLAIWISTVMIIPRAGVIAADSMVNIPSDSELASQKSTFAAEKNSTFSKELSAIYAKRNEPTQGMSREEARAYRDEKEWEWMEEDDKLRKEKDAEISEYNTKLMSEISNKRNEKARLAFTLARISPVASFQLIAMKLSQTDLDLKTRYLESATRYKTEFTGYLEQKQKETGDPGGIRIEMNADGFKFDMSRSTGIDFSDRPRFQHPEVSLKAIIPQLLGDFSLLGITGLLFFGLSFIGFLRYDMR